MDDGGKEGCYCYASLTARFHTAGICHRDRGAARMEKKNHTTYTRLLELLIAIFPAHCDRWPPVEHMEERGGEKK